MTNATLPPPAPARSPRWGSSIKTVVAFTFIAIVAALLIQFHTIIGPLLMAFILSYLLHPVASFINRFKHISWRASVGVLFLIILVLLLGLLTLGGVGLVNQIQSLITLLDSSLNKLPTIINDLAAFGARFGLDLTKVDVTSLSDQLLSLGQNFLRQIGSLISSLAGSAASFLGWTLFVLLISFFVLAESGGLRRDILKINVPGYAEDLRRLEDELALIWNAFLRGQIIIFGMTVAIYFVVLNVLGVRYAIGLALGAGFARFVPYVGPAINWTALALVSFFNPMFGMEPLWYTLMVFLIALFIDQIFDNIVSPRIMADALKVHPAAVLVAAIISANLLGVLGVVIAAPMLATIQLFGTYVFRKMFDLNPWPDEPARAEPESPSVWTRASEWWTSMRKKMNRNQK